MNLLSAVQAAEVDHLRGEIAFDERRVGDATRLLVSAAKRLEPLSPQLARTTHLEALGAAIWSADLDGPGALLGAAQAARAAPPAPDPPDAADVVLDALALRLTDGFPAAAPALEHALQTVLALQAPAGDLGRWLWLTGLRATGPRIVIPKSISRPLLRLNPVVTSPGWKQFAVTPVPSRRRASSVVNRMLASLVSP